MITPGDLRNMPMFHGRKVRRGVKVPMQVIALNGYNDNMFTATDSLRPTDPEPRMNDYGSLFTYGRLGETAPGAGPSGFMAKVRQYKWPLLIGGAVLAGAAGWYLLKRARR